MHFLGTVALHAHRYPLWRAPDVYKLLHQAVLGSEHAVSDPEAAHRWLEQELAELEPGPEEPLVDPIRPDGRLTRIHLRPYLAGGYDPADLLNAFLQTAASPAGAAETFQNDIDSDAAAAIDEILSLRGESFRDILEKMRPLGFPAIHHSPEFVQAYRPAYRVVATRFLAGPLRRER